MVLQEVHRREESWSGRSGHAVGRILRPQLHLELPPYKARSLEEVPLRSTDTPEPVEWRRFQYRDGDMVL